ncbi:Imm50 family immunity protein [Pseudomonas sp. NFX15]|uniref:Imm50 family immunity protein n=1 Tax=Pseudomonas sp. NFX15 TaxID=2816958 RepID=UPI003B8CACAF
MKYWNDFEGSVFFNMVFSGLIEVGEVKLFSFNIDNVGATVALAFDIKELPDKPPLKWRAINYNACRVGISCSEVSDLSVRDLPTSSVLALTVERYDSRFRVSVGAENSLIEFTAAYVRLRDPSVYFTDDVF